LKNAVKIVIGQVQWPPEPWQALIGNMQINNN